MHLDEEFKPDLDGCETLLQMLRHRTTTKEWGDFKTCPTVAGCPAAPRGCPGTFLSMHIAKETVQVSACLIKFYP